MLTDKEAQELGNALNQLVRERGMGALSKKDYELMVFYHLSASSEMRFDGNYVLANKLKVTETKVKALRLESSIRHGQTNHQEVLKAIVHRILEEMNKPEFTGGVVLLTLENPIDRREFEYAVKLAKHTVEYGINREILKIAPLAMFDVIMANIEKPEARFKEVVQACIRTREHQKEVLDNTLTFRQKINKLGEEISNNGGAVQMLSVAAGFL